MGNPVGGNDVKLKIFPMLLVMLVATVGSELAVARGHGGGHGGGYRGGYVGARIGFGSNLGFPVYGTRYFAPPAYYYSPLPYYYPAAVTYYYPPVAPQAPQPYIEQSGSRAPPPAQQAQGSRYYCAGSNAYYPDVRECLEGWQRGSPQPPSG
jgi:hypothetical protein